MPATRFGHRSISAPGPMTSLYDLAESAAHSFKSSSNPENHTNAFRTEATISTSTEKSKRTSMKPSNHIAIDL